MKSGIIKLDHGRHQNAKAPELGVNFVDEVVAKLTPILENLVTKTVQDMMEKISQDKNPQPQEQPIAITLQESPAQKQPITITLQESSAQKQPITLTLQESPAQKQPIAITIQESSAHKDIEHPFVAEQTAEDDWDTIYIDIEPAPPAPRLSRHESQNASSLFRPKTSAPQSHPHATLSAHSRLSTAPPTAPRSTPWAETAMENTLSSQSSACDTASAPVVQRWTKPVHTLDNALTCMGQLLKVDNPTWSCSEQKVAMQAVLERRNDVLAIMRTSSGKSMLMVVPSLLENGSITIGIVPLNSLLLDYSRKLKAQHIPFQIFHSHDSPTLHGNQSLVLTTVDQARTQSWKQQIGELNQRIPVVRVVFDEGHFAITDNDFRTVLDDVYELRQFAVQLVVLSATIPPKSEATIRQAFGMMDSTLVVRTSTRRPELQYIVEEPLKSNSDIADRVEAIIQETSISLKKEDRILVFVPYLDNGVNLAKQLDCDFFCGGRTLSAQDRHDMYQNWVEGVNRVMVCTHAFGAGNDYPHVPLVIHAGTPHHMMGYIQESSRAGRNKQPSRCIIIPRKQGAPPTCPNPIDHKGQRDMYDMLFGTNKGDCITHALSRFNDGTGVRCFNAWNSKKCSRCLGLNTSTGTKPSKGQQIP